MTKILLIEDDQLVLNMYSQAFLAEKFEVEKAADGREGIAKAKAILPDLILCDVMMPEMNGMDVLDGLKKDPATKNIPVIMLTNLAGTQDVEVAKEKGAMDYIVKSSLKPKQVVDRVKALVK